MIRILFIFLACSTVQILTAEIVPLEQRLKDAHAAVVASTQSDVADPKVPSVAGRIDLPQPFQGYFKRKDASVFAEVRTRTSGEYRGRFVDVTISLQLEKKGGIEFERGILNESQILHRLFDTKEVKSYLQHSNRCFISITYSYLGDWGDGIYFPAFMIKLSPMPATDEMTIILPSGLDSVFHWNKRIQFANGKIAIAPPKGSSIAGGGRLHTRGGVIPYFRLLNEEK